LQGELEAHIGMVEYALNSCLLKYPEKLHSVKQVLKRGKIHMIGLIFREMSKIIQLAEDRYESEPKMYQLLLKRLGATVLSLQAAQKIKFEIIPNEEYADVYRKAEVAIKNFL